MAISAFPVVTSGQRAQLAVGADVAAKEGVGAWRGDPSCGCC